MFSELLSYPLRSGVTVAASCRGRGIKMLNMKELFQYSRIPSVDMSRVEIDFSDVNRFLLERDDLLFARRSLVAEGAGRCSIVHEVDGPTTWESSIIRARMNSSKADARYYFYYFSSRMGRRQVETIVEQVAAAGIRSSELARLEVPCPPLPVQKSIAEVLGALDDKIAANERTLARGASLARTLLEDAAKGGPLLRLRDIVVSLTRGIAPRYIEAGGVTVLNQKCVRGQRVELAPARRSGRTPSSDRMLVREDALVNSTGYGTLGRVARWTRQDVAATVDSHVTIVRFDEAEVDPVCAGLALVGSECSIEQLAEGSTGQTELKRDLLGALKLRLPAREVQQVLRPKLRAIDDFELSRRAENGRLAATRNELLPLLMSEKLRVKDAEKAVEDVL